MADLTGMMQAAAGAAGGDKLYVEDVFSTYLYTGNGSTQTITNGIDLDGEGGLVWIKSRSAATNNFLFDTERGVTDEINSNTTDAEASLANSLTAFNSDGFSISSATGIGVSAATYASWTFRKAPKFFDVVTYTGNGTTQTISHDLGSTPGMVIIKITSGSTGVWMIWHRSLSSGFRLNFDTGAATNSSSVNIFGNNTVSVDPTSTSFTVGSNANVNGNTFTYVAYLFAHDAGGFGDAGDENVISCGSYTGNGSATGTVVTLGYEPQWLLVKRTDTTGDWNLIDNMRGFVVGGTDAELNPNLSNAESTGTFVSPTATGFQLNTTDAGYNASGGTYIYIAIRRGPMKTPTAGTEVFAPNAYAGGTAGLSFSLGFVPDTLLTMRRNTSNFDVLQSRLTGLQRLVTNEAGAEGTAPSGTPTWDANTNTIVLATATSVTEWNSSGSNYVNEAFGRAPGFFDVVCYTGTGSATTFVHNLGVVPELMIMKKRGASDDWAVYAGDNTDFLILNSTAATADDNTYWNDTSPTSTVFSVGTNADVNTSAATYIAYLFASLAGVSKVGTYTGNGSSVTVTTGFQPRFILVKRTDSTGNWIVGDSARGLVAGDDPYLLLNSNAAEDTDEDWVDVSATGFTVNETAANANVNAGTYIYLAIS